MKNTNACEYDIDGHAGTHWRDFSPISSSHLSGESALLSNFQLPPNLIGVAPQSKQSFALINQSCNALFTIIITFRVFALSTFSTYLSQKYTMVTIVSSNYAICRTAATIKLWELYISHYCDL